MIINCIRQTKSEPKISIINVNQMAANFSLFNTIKALKNETKTRIYVL